MRAEEAFQFLSATMNKQNRKGLRGEERSLALPLLLKIP
jgi:hypothetical protein